MFGSVFYGSIAGNNHFAHPFLNNFILLLLLLLFSLFVE